MKKIFTVMGTIFAAGTLAAAMTLSAFAAPVTEEKAKSIALEHAGVTAEDVIFMESKSDFENGRPVYEIEFLTSDYREYDYEIDTDTGEILSLDYDAEYSFPAKDSTKVNSHGGSSGAGTAAGTVSLEDAKSAALNYAGLNAADVTWGKVKPDHDDGRIVYEGEFYYGLMEYEFEVDAATGTVIDWEMESIYD